MHKALDEILLPTYDKLMNENKNERLKEHSRTRNKELEILNEMDKEVEKVNYDNITAVFALSDEIEKMKAEIIGEMEAVVSLKSVAEIYGKSQSMVIDSINEYTERLNEEIERKTERVLSEVEEIKVHEMQELNIEMLEFAKAKRQEDEKRDALQREILQSCQEQVAVTQAGFQDTNRNLNSINNNVMEGNRIAQEGNIIAKEGFDSLNTTIEAGNQNIIQKLHQGNAINAALAKKQGINLHDEPWYRIDRKVRNSMSDLAGSFAGKNTVEKEGEKFNG
jgi:hypothetical protein